MPIENISNAKQNVIIGVVMNVKNSGLIIAKTADSTVHSGNKFENKAEND